MGALTASIHEQTGTDDGGEPIMTMVKKRAKHIDYINDIGLSAGSITKVENPLLVVDKRIQFSYLTDDIIKDK